MTHLLLYCSIGTNPDLVWPSWVLQRLKPRWLRRLQCFVGTLRINAFPGLFLLLAELSFLQLEEVGGCFPHGCQSRPVSAAGLLSAFLCVLPVCLLPHPRPQQQWVRSLSYFKYLRLYVSAVTLWLQQKKSVSGVFRIRFGSLEYSRIMSQI